jgi:DNA-directed RNA polymerase subunit M/transcription elongation factor TFIIS
MRLKETPISQYLSFEDSKMLVALLQKNNIPARRKDMLSGEGNEQDIHEVLIDESDLNLASVIVQKFHKEQKLQRVKLLVVCPKCQSTPPVTHVNNKLNFFKKILSIGTTAMICDKCGEKWYI